MVATHGLRQLQADVSEAEEAELRRLEDGATAGGDGDRRASPQSGGDDISGEEAGSVGVVVAGAKRRAEQLDSKKFAHGGFRESFKVTRLQPRGGAGLKAKVPKRKDFGDEGEEGDAAHGAAMKEFSMAEFGCSHVQDRTLDLRMQRVGLFGHWLQLNKYGKHVEWKVSDGARASQTISNQRVVGARQLREVARALWQASTARSGALSRLSATARRVFRRRRP